MKQAIVMGAACLIAGTSFGQLTIKGQYRPRAEYRHGYKTLADTNQNPAFSIDQRLRLSFEYKVADYEFFATVQDIRTWGANSQLNVSDGFLSLHEGWAKVNFKNNWGLKLGRQEIDYDDARIFGNVDWTQQARSHDAALIQYTKEGFKFDLGFAFNQPGSVLVGTDYTVASSYRDMQYIWLNKNFGTKVNFSFLALNLGQQVNVVDANGDPDFSYNYTQTVGTHAKFKGGKLNIDFNGFVQMGSPQVAPVTPLFAVLGGVDISYKVSDNFSAILGYEYQSGKSQTDTTKSYNEQAYSFNPYFGTNHKFNGYMDYFYVGNHINSVGLQDAYLKFKYARGKSSVELDGHIFMAAADVLDKVELSKTGKYTAMNPMLGTEIDLTFKTKLNESVTLVGGYSHMIGTETMGMLKNVVYTTGTDAGKGRIDQISNWAYVMIVIKPTLYSGK